MTIRTFLAAAASIAVLASPALVHAQSAEDLADARQYAAVEGFHGYPVFRGDEARIREQIRDGRADGSLTTAQADDFRAELSRIQDDEALNFRDNGWELPDYVRSGLQDNLDDLSSAIDTARAPA